MAKNTGLNWPIVGHQNIISYLEHCLLSGQLAHAYLFVGPSQIGKTKVADFFSQALICQNFSEKKKPLPCGLCPYCRQAQNHLHPDIFRVERELNDDSEKFKKNISIEQVRELQNKLNLRSFLDSFKIAIINQAQALSQEAANSLLKTLEEPAPKTILIILATHQHLLLQTIVSRCQVLKFLPVKNSDLVDYLIGQRIDRKKAKNLAALAFGRPGVAIDYLSDQSAYEELTSEIKQFISILQSDVISRFKIINELVVARDIDGLKKILFIWSKVIRDLLLIKNSLPNLISHAFIGGELTRVAEIFSPKTLMEIIKQLNLTRRYLDANLNPRLTFENLVLTF